MVAARPASARRLRTRRATARTGAGLAPTRWLIATWRFFTSRRRRWDPAATPGRGLWAAFAASPFFGLLRRWHRTPTRLGALLTWRAWLFRVRVLGSWWRSRRTASRTGTPFRWRCRLVLGTRRAGCAAPRSRFAPGGSSGCCVHGRACFVLLLDALLAEGSRPLAGPGLSRPSFRSGFHGLGFARFGPVRVGFVGLGLAGLGFSHLGGGAGVALFHQPQDSHQHRGHRGTRHHRETVDEGLADSQSLGQHVAVLGQARHGEHDEWDGQGHGERWLHHGAEEALALNREDRSQRTNDIARVEDHRKAVGDELVDKSSGQSQPERQQHGTPPRNTPAGVDDRAFVPRKGGRVFLGAFLVTPAVTNGGHEAIPYPVRGENL